MRILKLLAALNILIIPSSAFAAITALDVQDILGNLQKILNPTLGMLMGVSFILGVIFILRGLLQLKSFSLPMNQATRPGELSGPLISILVGTVMIYIPTSTDVLSTTLFGSVPSMFPSGGGSFVPNIENLGRASDQVMGYAPQALESQWATLIDTVVYYMQFIGFLAFMRGWVIIAHAGQHHGQPGTISKGLIHIVGGILAINFLPLVNAVTNTISGT
jgi:intracellular multiplication protein IcmC